MSAPYITRAGGGNEYLTAGATKQLDSTAFVNLETGTRTVVEGQMSCWQTPTICYRARGIESRVVEVWRNVRFDDGAWAPGEVWGPRELEPFQLSHGLRGSQLIYSTQVDLRELDMRSGAERSLIELDGRRPSSLIEDQANAPRYISALANSGDVLIELGDMVTGDWQHLFEGPPVREFVGVYPASDGSFLIIRDEGSGNADTHTVWRARAGATPEHLGTSMDPSLPRVLLSRVEPQPIFDTGADALHCHGNRCTLMHWSFDPLVKRKVATVQIPEVDFASAGFGRQLACGAREAIVSGFVGQPGEVTAVRYYRLRFTPDTTQ